MSSLVLWFYLYIAFSQIAVVIPCSCLSFSSVHADQRYSMRSHCNLIAGWQLGDNVAVLPSEECWLTKSPLHNRSSSRSARTLTQLKRWAPRDGGSSGVMKGHQSSEFQPEKLFGAFWKKQLLSEMVAPRCFQISRMGFSALAGACFCAKCLFYVDPILCIAAITKPGSFHSF